jgi:hypothetical protein
MTKTERTVAAGPGLSGIADALPQGLRAADPAELANVQGGAWWELPFIILCPGGAAIYYGAKALSN